jgi:hypothetical protein
MKLVRCSKFGFSFAAASFFLIFGLQACGTSSSQQDATAASNQSFLATRASENQLSADLLRRIRLNLVAHRVNVDADTSRKETTSEDVILETIAQSLASVNDKFLSKSQIAALKKELQAHYESALGQNWAEKLAALAGLPSEFATATASEEKLLGGFFGSLAEILGYQGRRPTTIFIDLSRDSKSAGIKLHF